MAVRLKLVRGRSARSGGLACAPGNRSRRHFLFVSNVQKHVSVRPLLLLLLLIALLLVPLLLLLLALPLLLLVRCGWFQIIRHSLRAALRPAADLRCRVLHGREG